MLDKNQITEFFSKIYEFAGSFDTNILLMSNRTDTTRFSNNTITQHVSQQDQQVMITLRKENTISKISTNQLDRKTLEQTVQKAKENFKFQKPLPELSSLVGKQEYQPKDNYDDAVASLSPLQKAEWLNKSIKDAQKRDLELAGVLTNQVTQLSLGNSQGGFASHPFTEFDVDISVTGDNKEGWASDSAYSLDQLDVSATAQRAMEIAIKNHNPISIEAGEYDTVLSHDAAAELCFFLAYVTFGTKGILDGASYLSDKLGQPVFSEKLSISDNLFHPLIRGIPFDFEGMPTRKVELIKNGIFKEMVLDSKYAKKVNGTSTGHSLPQPNTSGPYPSNLVIEPGTSTLDTMISQTQKGLFVNRFHYTNVHNPMDITLTGMTRDGLFLIEDGKITKPVKNLRYTESLAKAFNNLADLSSDQKSVSATFGGSFVVPAMKINGFRFSSKTEF